ncbi:GntR family transcriptional regulator [Paenibacillus jiagnxiensis]|uniref:GntR family transcriptional regulator n=1 Tax=Paenibacillus jiagnxiensis TaxID=3228926 RepID=UPI0033BA9074
MSKGLKLPERQTLAEVIYQEIRNRIVTLQLKPGEMVFENSFATEFNLSRTPVRQAFFMLAQEELISILPQRGARIADLSIEKVKEAQMVRESLEITAFIKAAEKWNGDEEVFKQADKTISSIIEEQKESVIEMDYIRFIKLDEDFHNEIIKLSGNHTLLSIVNDMRAHLNRVRYLELKEAHHEKEAIGHHEHIFMAIKSNDASLAGRLLKEHLKMLENDRERIFAKHKDMFI